MRPAVQKTGDVSLIARQLLGMVFRFRRLSSGHDEACVQSPCEQCFAPHLEQVKRCVARGEPLHLILPAFPAKSPNPRKVLGPLPDMAEQVALGFLQSLCEHLGHVYAPGARLTICSDGRVFSDLVSVRDEDVTHYKRELVRLLDDIGGSAISLYTLEDLFGGIDHDEMRRRLTAQYATPLEALRWQVQSEPDARNLFNGIHRFLFEDQVVLRPAESRNKLRQSTQELAYKTIQRSNAWSRLIAERFPNALRLSIHPQPLHSSKLGIHLVGTKDNWLTPWHGVVLDTGKGLMLVKRQDAELMKATLVMREQRPSHFVAPSALQEHVG
ncbi:PvcA protein [Cystobacter fuscus DSM 2262]|uniref:PvcA protein n=1 Tax=Cystobacter fuscus (strain ATCC 25194 / DSM 2262 / NBRC 100088 / M29) TaxID=1242864 RepID=S9QR64_CYSF2|nr:isocyanide synthase family protein [Cystobacter fuscus]EPX63804.1 PvcA protein [Cystobacter fuscus DSM 2262]